jgi:hypothetical protein
MLKVSDVPTPIVGRYYLVPCVDAFGYRGGKVTWPVMGPIHNDADIGITFEHYHLDLRFLSDRAIRRWVPDPKGTSRGITREQEAMTRVLSPHTPTVS